MDIQLSYQLMITVDNQVGTLAGITNVVSSAGINLIAVCAYAVDNQGFILFVTENNNQAKKLLEEKGYNVREEEIVLVSLKNKAGALEDLTQKVAEARIDLTLLYGSVDKNAKKSRLVLVSEDNHAVLSLLKIQ